MNKIVIIPASGKGLRMNHPMPKQYIKLYNGLTIIDNTITQLLKMPFFNKVVVVLDSNDKYWLQSRYNKHQKILQCLGGKTRSESVFNGLLSLKNKINDNDWIFVHDAVRPCIQLNDIAILYNSVITEKAMGGILACRAIDTVKQTDYNKNIIKNLIRNYTYLAQTPQMFQYHTLLMAYRFCLYNNITITDESSAVAILKKNQKIIIVENDRKNIKITNKEDIIVTNYFLSLLE